MSTDECADEFSLKVEQVGDFRVTIHEKVSGSPKIGSLLTIHDIGLNAQSYIDFLKHEDNVQLFDKFIVYHVEVPGQHKDAEQFAPDYQFLPLPKMADRMIAVLERFHLKDVIGLGVGAGAVILINLAMAAPEKFLGITVIDPAGKSPGFKEWGEEKLAIYQLEKKGFTSSAEKFLIWHLFGTKGKQGINMEMVDKCINDITHHIKPYNLSKYVDAFMHRTDFMHEIHHKLKCQVLIITSNHSPYKENAYEMVKQLDVKKSSVLESDNTINAFFEDPGKCGEGMLLLMQGLGLVPTLRTRTASRGGSIHRTSSMSEDEP